MPPSPTALDIDYRIQKSSFLKRALKNREMLQVVWSTASLLFRQRHQKERLQLLSRARTKKNRRRAGSNVQ